MAHLSSAAGEWWKALGNGAYVECKDQDGLWCLGVLKNQSARGAVDVHIVGRHTVHDRKIEPGECYTQLRPLWSSQYNDSTLRYLREKNVLEPASSVAGIEELKQDPASAAYQLAAAWLTPQRSARPTTDTGSSGITGVAPSTSDGSWFLAQPKMWVEGIDADGEWWPANIIQSHPVKGVNLHFLGKPTTADRWVEPSACSTLLRPLPRMKSKQYSDELWDELHRRLSKQHKQPPSAAAAAVGGSGAEERKEHSSVPSKLVPKLYSPAPAMLSSDVPGVTPLSVKHKAVKLKPSSPPITASATTDRTRIASSSSSSSSGSPTQPAPPNEVRPMKLTPSHTASHDSVDTFHTPGKDEAHPLPITPSKRIVEQLNALQARHDSEITQLRDELAAFQLDNSRLQSQLLRAPQPPPAAAAVSAAAAGGADLLIVHTLHERYNRAVSRLESEPPAVSDELLSELRGLVDWHLEMTGRLNRLLRLKETEIAAALPSYS